MIAPRLSAYPWIEKIVLVAIPVIAWQMHSLGAPERADAAGPAFTAAGVILGAAILVIVAARLLGKRLPGIASDRSAIVAVIGLIAVKIAIARVLLP